MRIATLILILVCHVSACSNDDEVERVANEAAINFVAYGNGSPVILVHGFSQTHKAWEDTPIFADLRKDHQVIAVDLRGHGDSPKPHEPEDYGRKMAADLVRLMDALEIQQAHFVGFSMGASVVGDLLITSPERVRTATMASGLFTRWDPEEEAFAVYTEQRATSGERFPWEPENQDFRALAAVIRGARFASVSADQIEAISVPVLVVYGSVELHEMHESDRERLDALPPSFQTLIIEGADHDSPNAAVLSDEFAVSVRELIDAHPMQDLQR